ncbi:MAG: hypothetical protein AAB952_01770, partial [Patescibacteria group bacterium]
GLKSPGLQPPPFTKGEFSEKVKGNGDHRWSPENYLGTLCYIISGDDEGFLLDSCPVGWLD